MVKITHNDNGQNSEEKKNSGHIKSILIT